MKINIWTDVDAAALQIGLLQRDIKEEEILLNDMIDKMKNAAAAKIAGKRSAIADIEAQIEEFVETNKKEILQSAKKSKDLTFCTVGFRDSGPEVKFVRGFGEESIAKALMKAGYEQCVNVKYKVIKNALKALEISEEKLSRFGVKLRYTKNKFFLDINEAKIAEEKR